VGSSLLGTFVQSAISLIMTLKRKRYFIVKVVVYVELEAAKISSIATPVSVVLLLPNKEIIHVSKESLSKIAQSVWMICIHQDKVQHS
jgi:hypothetical protein